MEGWDRGLGAPDPDPVPTKDLLGEWVDQVHPEQFLFRSQAHVSDAQRGLGILWLASNDEWKKRVTEELTIPRLDTLGTTVQVDVDVATIQRHGLRADAQKMFWLPLLLSGPNVPSVLGVTDEADQKVPHLTTAEVRWALSAALADLAIRSNPDPEVQRRRLDVELVLSAVFRQYLDEQMRDAVRSAHRDGPLAPAPNEPLPVAPRGLDRSNPRSDHDRRRALHRLRAAKAAVQGAEWRDPTVVRLARSLAGVRMLVVGCPHDDVRESYRCALPSRRLTVAPKERTSTVRPPGAPGGPGSLEVRPDTLGLVGASKNAHRRRSKVKRWTRREGPATGRTGVRIELLAMASAANYHVVVTMPERTEAFDPRVTMEWDLGRLAHGLREAWPHLRTTIDDLDTDHSPGEARAGLILLQRDAAWVSNEGMELSAFLRSLANGPATAETRAVPATRDQDLETVIRHIDHHLSSLEELQRLLDRHPLLRSPPPGGHRTVGSPPARTPTEVDPACREVVARGEEVLAHLPGEATVAATYVPRDAIDTDRVHITVPSTDRVDRRIEMHRTHLFMGVRLADPRPHTVTNRANLMNVVVLALAGLTIAAVQWARLAAGRPAPTLEVDAVVAVVLLFAGVQAARIERPGRTLLAGWLARMPYTLGFLSPLPAVGVSIAAIGGVLTVADGAVRPIVSLAIFGVAAVVQLGFLFYGVHALREAARWDGPPRLVHNPTPEDSGLDPMTTLLPDASQRLLEQARYWMARRRNRQRPGGAPAVPPGREIEVPSPDRRLLGEVIRSLPAGSMWFVPLITTDDHIVREGQDRLASDGAVARLHASDSRRLIGEAQVQLDVHRSWHMVKVVMGDRPGALDQTLTFLDPGTVRGGRRAEEAGPAIDIATALSASFGGHATLQMLVADRPGHHALARVDTPSPGPKAPRARRSADPHHPTIIRSSDPVDTRTAPIRAFVDIFELMIRLPLADMAPELRRLAVLTGDAGLHLVLVHAPSTPPGDELVDDEDPEGKVDATKPIWLRARVGVTAKNRSVFRTFLTDYVHGLPLDHRIRVSSVNEFAGPATGITPGEEHLLPMLVSDRTATTGRGPVTYLLIDTVSQVGVVRRVITHLMDEVPGPGIIAGVTGNASVGRGILTVYLDTAVAPAAVDGLLQLLRDDDPTTTVTSVPRRGWSGLAHPTGPQRARDRQRQGAGVRLTWNCPNVPGFLGELVRGLSEAEGRANLSYVVARVAEVDDNLGRLVFRLEDVHRQGDQILIGARGNGSLPITVEDHVARLTARLNMRMQRLVDAHLHRHPEDALLANQVFISADVFRVPKE